MKRTLTTAALAVLLLALGALYSAKAQTIRDSGELLGMEGFGTVPFHCGEGWITFSRVMEAAASSRAAFQRPLATKAPS